MRESSRSQGRGGETGAGRAFIVEGCRIAAAPLDPGLHVVATPIGNLADVTLRALATLAAADRIACEDTRITRRLLDRYGINRPLTAYHEHNAEAKRPELLAALQRGEAVALVSDAGTPLVSDPGYRLVRAAAEAGHRVIPVPGPCAALAGLVAAGLPTDTFLFAGFLPSRGGPRTSRLRSLSGVPATLVFYESPRRLVASLAAMADILGRDRSAAVARELTKHFEEVRRGGLGSLAEHYRQAGEPKGEVVVLVGPPNAAAGGEIDVDAALAEALSRLKPADAASEVARATGRPRRALYARALELRTGGR